MNERETITCPSCGAPYSEDIPDNVAQVKCKYCKSVILLPSNLRAVPRCPNHTDTVAMTLCNDCGGAFCPECLHIYQLRGGKIYLCSFCLKRRRVVELFILSVGTALAFIITLFAIPSSIYIFIIFGAAFLLLAVAILYTLIRFPRKEIAKPPSLSTSDPEALYWLLWRDYTRNFGVTGPTVLGRRIQSYLEQGFSREEAIRRLAEIEQVA